MGDDGQATTLPKTTADCMSCRLIGTTVSLGASVYLLAFVYGPKSPVGLHRNMTLAFAGGFAALGLARALV